MTAKKCSLLKRKPHKKQTPTNSKLVFKTKKQLLIVKSLKINYIKSVFPKAIPKLLIFFLPYNMSSCNIAKSIIRQCCHSNLQNYGLLLLILRRFPYHQWESHCDYESLVYERPYESNLLSQRQTHHTQWHLIFLIV